MSIPQIPRWLRWVVSVLLGMLALKVGLHLIDQALSKPVAKAAAQQYVKSSTLTFDHASEIKAYYDIQTTTYTLVVTPQEAAAPFRVVPDVSNRVFATLIAQNPDLVAKIKHFPDTDIPPGALQAVAVVTAPAASTYPGAPLVRTAEAAIDGTFSFVATHIFQILGLVVMLVLLKFVTQPGMEKKNESVILPENLTGSLDDIIGLQDIKAEVKAVIEMLRNPEPFHAHGVGEASNLLFTGPAGTGKTKIAGFLAKELKAPLLTIAGSNLESGLVGGGSRRLRQMEQTARRLAAEYGLAVIFIDEGQTLFQQRGRGGPLASKHQDDTANTLLSILDGVRTTESDQARIIWIVASNFDDQSMDMDPAVLRRFPHKINFRLPNRGEREQMLAAFLAKTRPEETAALQAGSPTLQILARLKLKHLRNEDNPAAASPLVDIARLDLRHVAAVTEGLSPAHLESIVKQAKLTAIRKGTKIDADALVQAFERATIGLTDRETTQELERTRAVIAHHEMGHFVMELDNAVAGGGSLAEIFDRLHTLKISLEAISNRKALGYVLSRLPEDKLMRRTQLELKIRQLYGGVAAEEVFYGEAETSTGASDDIAKATQLILSMTHELNMYSHVKLSQVEAEKHGIKLTPQTEPEALSRRLYEETLQRVSYWRPLIEELVPVLLADYFLTKDQLIQRLSASPTFLSLAQMPSTAPAASSETLPPPQA